MDTLSDPRSLLDTSLPFNEAKVHLLDRVVAAMFGCSDHHSVSVASERKRSISSSASVKASRVLWYLIILPYKFVALKSEVSVLPYCKIVLCVVGSISCVV